GRHQARADARADQGGEADARLRTAVRPHDGAVDDRHVHRSGVQKSRRQITMKRSALIFVAAVAVLAGAGRAFAHHSFTAAYESGKRVEIEGVVKEFIWRNPHSFVRIDVMMKDGTTETWNLEWGSSTQLSAAKYPVTRTTLKFGDRILATGEPGRDPEAHRIRISSIRRPVDGWEWQGVVE